MNTMMEDGKSILVLSKMQYDQYQILEIVQKLTGMVSHTLFGIH